MSNNYSFTTNKDFSINDFFESNSLVAKCAFLLIVIFIFMILFKIGLFIVEWISSANESPKLINGMVNANQSIVFVQDPKLIGSKTIYRSDNQDKGIEFTWSVWIFIEDLQYLENNYRCVFFKGNNSPQTTGLNFPNNAPGLYIMPNTNSLVVMMNSYDEINEEIVIPDIPINNWVNIIIRCENTKMDVYINGVITKSTQLMGVPKQNYGDVNVAMNGGFSGYISNLWYFNYALGTTAIQKIASDGPNITMASASSLTNTKPTDYLSLRWHFYGAGDSYNPTA